VSDPRPPPPAVKICCKPGTKTCTDPTCTTLVKPPKNIVVNLTDQFGRPHRVA
jgi:hypothetical protein